MDTSAILLANGNLRIKRTRNGLMVYNINDSYIGQSLDCYGEYSHGEMMMFAQLMRPGSMAIDVGANIGAHTLFLARVVGSGGSVVAIEPQRAIYQLLCANLALNELLNVHAIHAGVGSEPGTAFIPVLDYDKAGNFGGGVTLSDTDGDPVDVVSIDSLQLSACHFMKIDVEGQEHAVIAGATETIARFRPTLYVENDRRAKSSDLIRQISALDYVLFWHLPPYYSNDNFYQNPTNMFPNEVSVNMLCLPQNDSRQTLGMRPVRGPDDWPLAE
jgi:FkbM family methyltransferase